MSARSATPPVQLAERQTSPQLQACAEAKQLQGPRPVTEDRLEAEIDALLRWCEFVAVAVVGPDSCWRPGELVGVSVRQASVTLQAPDMLCEQPDNRFVVVVAGSGEAADRFDLFAERLHRQVLDPIAVGYVERRVGDQADHLLARARRRFETKRSPATAVPIAAMRFPSSVRTRRLP